MKVTSMRQIPATPIDHEGEEASGTDSDLEVIWNSRDNQSVDLISDSEEETPAVLQFEKNSLAAESRSPSPSPIVKTEHAWNSSFALVPTCSVLSNWLSSSSVISWNRSPKASGSRVRLDEEHLALQAQARSIERKNLKKEIKERKEWIYFLKTHTNSSASKDML